MKKSIKITKQSNLLALNGAEYKIPYSDGQQYLADDTNIIYEDVGGKRMAITEVRYTDIGNNTIDSLDTNGVNTDWRNFFTIIKSIKPNSPNDIVYNLYYYNVNGERIPISIEGITIEGGVLNLSEQAGSGLIWDNDNKKLNINIDNGDFKFVNGVLTLKEKANNYPIIINPDDWNSEEGENYFYIDWPLAGLKTIDTIIVDCLPSYFWNLGLEAKIIENGIKFSVPKQFGDDGKPSNSLVLNVTVIKAQRTVDDIPIVPIEGQQIITGILTGAVDKFDTVYTQYVGGDATLISPAFNEIPLEYRDFGYALESGNEGDEIDMVLLFKSEPPANVVRFVSASSRTITPKYTNSGVTLQYSVDSGSTWTTIASGSATTSATEHWFRGEATGTKSLFASNTSSNAWAFSGSSDLEVYGNLNFLLCDTLGDEEAPTSLGTYAYAYMFYNCTSLTVAPELPATTLATWCYGNMFSNCTSLTAAPALPTTTLESFCYTNMFRNCSSLTTAPALPATTLAGYCYYRMFYGCTLLTTPPELPATTLEKNCYYDMFRGCTSFKVSATNTGSYVYAWRIPTLGTGTTASGWNSYMLSETGGTFTSDPYLNTTYWVVNKPV